MHLYYFLIFLKLLSFVIIFIFSINLALSYSTWFCPNDRVEVLVYFASAHFSTEESSSGN